MHGFADARERNQPSRRLDGIPQIIELWRNVFGGV